MRFFEKNILLDKINLCGSPRPKALNEPRNQAQSVIICAPLCRATQIPRTFIKFKFHEPGFINCDSRSGRARLSTEKLKKNEEQINRTHHLENPRMIERLVGGQALTRYPTQTRRDEGKKTSNNNEPRIHRENKQILRVFALDYNRQFLAGRDTNFTSRIGD